MSRGPIALPLASLVLIACGPPPEVMTAGDDGGVEWTDAAAPGPVFDPSAEPPEGDPCLLDGSEFPWYCGEGSLCTELGCSPSEPCRAVACEESSRECVGVSCASPEPEPPPEPSPEPAPEPEPAPTAPTTPELSVRLRWDSGGDMDLHVLNPHATRWQTRDDCYYGNCEGTPLEWGVPGPADNPALSRDVTGARGPEWVRITHPEPGTYRVGVNAYDGSSRVFVRVRCGHAAREVDVGPIEIGHDRDHRFWRSVDVTIDPGGSCSIRRLRSNAQPRDFTRR